MTENLRTAPGLLRKNLLTLVILLVFITSLIIPGVKWWQNPATPPMQSPVPGELFTPTPPFKSTLAGEANFTRESWPFILKNYPEFSWKNPGQFDASVTDGVGYNPALPPPGTGPEVHPAIFNALEGLNESYIRIAYLDANYEWVLVPYQIDQVGWPNVWQVADLNRWAGLDIFSLPFHLCADAVAGMGWINGDSVNSLGIVDSEPVNGLMIDWYRIPIHTYVTTYQPDGSYTSESVNIDQEYKEDLVWCYTGHANRPHDSWQQDDSPWRPYSGTTTEAFVNTSDGLAPDSTDMSNVVFMGDTWFITPSNDPSNPQWVQDAYDYAQIDGKLDKDDEIMFYVYPGRKASSNFWWNQSWFPHRFELEIVDPVDGGRCWMYIYYNEGSGTNPGVPSFTTDLKDYVSWDPDTMSVNSDFYQLSVDETNPSLLDGARLFGESDGQPLLESLNKICGFGEMSMFGLSPNKLSPIEREGTWYSWTDGSATTYSELYCTLDNPSVLYPDIPEDTSDPNRTAMTSPQMYYGPRGSVLGHTYSRGGSSPLGPSLQQWEQNYGDGRAIIDGPCRVITYLQQYLAIGSYWNYLIIHSSVNVDIDFLTSFMDGPQIYYRRMQLSPPTTMAMPYITITGIQLYYMYIMCGNIFTENRGDYKMTSAREWNGGPDGTDDNLPTFGWANEYGWTKIGGLDPKTTQYIIEGECIPDGNGGVGDLYVSQGDPLLWGNPAAAKPPLSNTLPDWVMLTSEIHGGAWIYMPRREFFEIRDNSPASPSANILMYYRDDNYRAEFGVCIDGGSAPYIQGGSTTSPYAFMIVYGDFKHESIALGHEFYMDYYFPLEGFTSFTQQVPAPQFLYNSVQSNQLIYSTGKNISIKVIGNTNNATVTVNFTEIEETDPIMLMTNHFDGTYTLTYGIDNVTPGPYERNIRLNASVPFWADSLYNLTITIDDDPPSPAARLLALPLTTKEATVLLNWSVDQGYDRGCASMANPSGLSHYRLRRGLSSSNYDTILADYIPITTTLFEDSFIQNNETYYYVLDTFDEVGNFNTSLEVFTNIVLPFTHAQPDALPATINPSSGITVDWTSNPSHIEGGSIDGYRVYRSAGLEQETALAGLYTEITSSEITETTFTDPGPFNEAYYYFYKVESRNNATSINSSAVHTRIDTIAPAPAELATPFPISYAGKAEISISWALETMPAYQSGGFPGHDLNGIDHWVIYKKTDAGPWTTFRIVPHGSEVKDQRIEDISVVNGSTYAYSIRTFDAAGNSALCEYNKTTTLHVIGPGIAEVHSVEAGTSEVTQGDQDIPITVIVRNPGINNVTLNEVKLYFVQGSTNITTDYTGVVQTPNSTLAAFTNQTYIFYVNLSDSATLGTVTITAQTAYNNTMSSIGASHPDSWLVKPDADLITQSVTSTYSVIHPGETNIPVTVMVTNPGDTLATLETVQLTFNRDDTDISDKFLVNCITGLPTGGFTGSQIINFNVIVSQAITIGGVTVDAIVSGSASGVSLSDEDGAETKLIWAVGTPIMPVIANIEADKEIYWAPDVITLMVTCDQPGYAVQADFSQVDVGAINETGTDNGDGTYTVAHALVNPVGEGLYDLIIYTTNASVTVTGTIRIRLGMAPTFSNWNQTPPDLHVLPGQAVGVTIDIDDNDGADNVQAIMKYRVDGRPWVCRSMSYYGNGHWQVTIPGQEIGSRVDYIINATDASSNWALFSKKYTCVDLALISPRNQSYNYQTIPIILINSSEINVAWYRNDSGMGWSANYTLVFNGTHFVNNSNLTWPDGFYYVQVFVNLSSGVEVSLDRWMMVDTQNPSGFQWFNTTSQYVQNKPLTWINGTAYDPPPSSGMSTFNIFISGSNTSAIWSNNVGSQADWAFYNLSPLQENTPNGFYQINVTIIDNAGNTITLSCNISVDATPPSGWQYLNTSLPQNARDGMVWINGSAIDYGSGLKSIIIVSDNITGGTSWSGNLGSNQSWSFINTSSIQNSPPYSVYEVIVEIMDLANNSFLLPCYFSVDFTPPSGCNLNYSIVYAPSFVLENTIFTLSGGNDFGGSGISHHQYKLDSGEWVISSTFILAGGSNGPHIIYYRAVDNVGNNGTIQNITIYLLANNADYDTDALTNYAEIFIYRTIAINPDTDGDGLSDGAEVITHGTDPNIPDMDGDGLPDGAEVIMYGTDPTDPDTDDDGISDGKEIALGADPLNPMNPLIGRILTIMGIIGSIILAGIIIKALKKKKKVSPPSQKLIAKETLGLNITRSIITAFPFLDQIFVDKGKLNLPTELLNFSFKELFSFNDTIISWVPEDEIKSRLNVLMRKPKNIEKKEDWERIFPNLKQLIELAESFDDRELYNKLIQLIFLIKYS
ncbi:MAG: hypothetical protein HWN65_19295 [Candidatus Helarchaeota archaeon]|nr:hypothetical protein [Candidatus Helarchaeota archaeon]